MCTLKLRKKNMAFGWLLGGSCHNKLIDETHEAREGGTEGKGERGQWERNGAYTEMQSSLQLSYSPLVVLHLQQACSLAAWSFPLKKRKKDKGTCKGNRNLFPSLGDSTIGKRYT